MLCMCMAEMLFVGMLTMLFRKSGANSQGGVGGMPNIED